MSDEQFKTTLQAILSQAIQEHREQLLVAFGTTLEQALASRVQISNFTQLAQTSARDAFNQSLHPLLHQHVTAHVTQVVDGLIQERLASPASQELIRSAVQAWLDSEHFPRLIAQRVGWALHRILTQVVEQQYGVSLDEPTGDDDDDD